MRYRIKVFPYNGTLYYMPQRKGWFIWHDLFPYKVIIDDVYESWQLEYMESEKACLEWVKREMTSRMDKDEKQKKIKKFEQDNPVRYIGG